METTKKRDWGLVVAGVLFIICGIICFIEPIYTLVGITIIAGAAFLVAGIFDIINYVRFHKTGGASGWNIFYAILDIVLGIMFLFWPISLAAVIPWVIGVFVIVFAVYEIIASFQVKKAHGSMWGWVLFSGILGVIIGLMFFIWPASFAIYIAAFLLLRGITLIIYGASTHTLSWV